MQKYILLFSVLILAACQDKKQENTAISTTTPQDSLKAAPAYDLLVQAVAGEDVGVLRGFNIGDDVSKIRKRELLELIEGEDTPEHIGYTLEMPSLETADIFYKKTKNKISGIEIDVYLNKPQDVAPAIEVFKQYFQKRYANNKTIQINISDQSKTKLPLIHIKIEPITTS